MGKTSASLRFTIHPGHQVDPQLHAAIVDLCTRAYEEDFTNILATFTNPVYIVGWIDDQVVTHALWVTRWLQVGDGPLLRTAYEEDGNVMILRLPQTPALDLAAPLSAEWCEGELW